MDADLQQEMEADTRKMRMIRAMSDDAVLDAMISRTYPLARHAHMTGVARALERLAKMVKELRECTQEVSDV